MAACAGITKVFGEESGDEPTFIREDGTKEWFNKYGDRAVFFSRLLPVVRTFISLPAGIGKYDLRKLVTFSFIGSLPWCFALAYIGFYLGPFWKNIIGFFNGLDIVVVVSIIIIVLYYWKLRK